MSLGHFQHWAVVEVSVVAPTICTPLTFAHLPPHPFRCAKVAPVTAVTRIKIIKMSS
jgi:hypothetical protein